jgi:hypothetical protein
MTKIESVLRASVGVITSASTWRRAIIENVYWASCEGLFQTALLTEVNRAGMIYGAGRERALRPYWKPDLVLMLAQDVSRWRAAIESRDRGDIAKAVVELKMVWTRKCGYANASLGAKAKEIQKQLTLLIQKGSRPSVFTGMCTRRSHRSRSVTQGASG